MKSLPKTLALALLLWWLVACQNETPLPATHIAVNDNNTSAVVSLEATTHSPLAASQHTATPTATLDRLREGLTAVSATRTAAPPADELTPTATPIITMSLAAETYLNEALAIIRENALNSSQVDWDRIETAARVGANGAVTTEDTYQVIQFVLRELNDHHSSFLTPEDATRWASLTIEDFPPVTSEIITEKIGYINIPGFNIGDPVAMEQHATIIQSQLAQLAAQNPCGWIVDLRDNTGGNMWPMLAGLGPLLGEGLQGYFVGPDADTIPWYYQDGKALLGDQSQVFVEQPVILEETDLPVAVLISDRTASAGEAIAIAFQGREKTRFFGVPTAGLSTANMSYELADGAMIFLTVAVDADRTGLTYGGELVPDEVTETGAATIDAAAAWLKTQPSCTSGP